MKDTKFKRTYWAQWSNLPFSTKRCPLLILEHFFEFAKPSKKDFPVPRHNKIAEGVLDYQKCWITKGWPNTLKGWCKTFFFLLFFLEPEVTVAGSLSKVLWPWELSENNSCYLKMLINAFGCCYGVNIEFSAVPK